MAGQRGRQRGRDVRGRHGVAGIAYPKEHPQRYGCGSWRHVIHESRQFEIRRTVNTEQGCGEVWYRSHQEGVSMLGKKAS
ncbi:hypothetical protein D7Y52_17400 [Stenotrophomonas maltophilia]|nr:hypothetical protein [Stenotrophomonas maltophilia]MBA0350598.1 hypothetical protein [Stenotrophomonas maltophilia]MBA0418259.1 hypothetical protein [Stenotrophomonas maltophilia]